MDTTVSAGKDFFQYANGTWIKNNPIPDDYTRWGSIEILADQNSKVLKQILEDAAQKSSSAVKGKIIQQVGDFYFSGMDTVNIEKHGIQPVTPFLQQIQNIKTKKDVFNLAVTFQKSMGANPFFILSSGPDLKNTNIVVAYTEQGGLGLPDMEYYIQDDNRSKETREKYVQYMTNIFKLAGKNEEQASRDAKLVMELETKFANTSFTKLENQDPYKTYNKLTVDSLIKLSPNFFWKIYLNEINLADVKELIVAQPKFFAGFNKILYDTPAENWKPFFEWFVLRNAASYLNSAFENERFEFEGKYLSGQKALRPRWKRVMEEENGYLGEAVGQLYVKNNFSPEAKVKARNLVMNLLESMKERISACTWMSEQTKQAALKKLSTFVVKIGYTDKWEDYTGYDVTRDSYVLNIIKGNAFHFRKDMEKIGKPFDKARWNINAQTVNAYYSPVKNEIAFPAAILQPPFFDPNADDAVNFGAIGAVIGHEITHGFDHQGRQYDSEGNLKDWWTDEDNSNFKNRAQVIINQYSSYAVLDTNRINGEFTQGENIADLGGLYVSFNAFKKTDQFKNNQVIDGFTPAQRFFLGFAQVWRNNIRDEALLMRLKLDVHSPGKQRVNGPLSNMPEFWEAFNIQPGEPMRRADDEVVKIW